MILKFNAEAKDIPDVLYVITTVACNDLHMSVFSGDTGFIIIHNIEKQFDQSELNEIFRRLNFEVSFATLVYVMAENGIPIDMFMLNNQGLPPKVNEHWKFIFED